MLNLSNKQYNIAKWTVQIASPAFATFYLTLGQLWGLPASDKVVGTLAALTTFSGIILGINSRRYNSAESELPVENVEVFKEEDYKGFLIGQNESVFDDKISPDHPSNDQGA